MLKYRGTGLIKAGFIGAVLIVLLILVGLSPDRIVSLATAVRYQALFSEAGGLAVGNAVTVSGIKVGTVSDVSLRNGDALVTFTMKGSVPLGTDTTAHIRTGTLLGERVLTLESAGSGMMHPLDVIPISRTGLAVLADRRGQRLHVVRRRYQHRDLEPVPRHAVGDAQPDRPTVGAHLRRGHPVIAKPQQPQHNPWATLFKSASDVTGILSERSQQVNKLILNSDDLLQVLVTRRQEIV